MINVILKERYTNEPLWVDVSDPTPEELAQIKSKYGLHETWVNDCVQHGHLPKYEKYGELTFIILRAYDDDSNPLDDNIREITRKVSFFLGHRFLISIHRSGGTFFNKTMEKYRADVGEIHAQTVLLEVLHDLVETYQLLIEGAEMSIHEFEMWVLHGASSDTQWDQIFRTQCRLSVTKRMLWHSLHTIQKFIPNSQANLPLCQDIRERIESLQFFTDGLLDDLNNIQSIQLALASNRLNESSHKTNEVMRTLTVFSMFFLPINFLVGLYGMNFEYMPELKFKYGYFGVWTIILITEFFIYLWFRKKGWLRAEPEPR